jgi:hypothetical protein
MITEVIDLERLLGQYDPGVVLVGPILRLSMSSIYRYFYIAGKGSKVYEATLGLGAIESETAAQGQRAVVVKELKSRFKEVQTFDSDLTMLQAVRARWPTEEIVAIWVPPSATSELTKAAGRQIDNGDRTSALLGNFGERSIDTEEPVDNSTYGLPSVRDQGQPMPVMHPAPTLVPLSLLVASATQSTSRDDRVGAQQRHSLLRQGGTESRASTILRLCTAGSFVVAVSVSLILVNRYRNPPDAALALPPSVPNRVAETSESALEMSALPAKVLPPAKSQPLQAASVQDRASPTAALPPPQSPPLEAASIQDQASPTAALPPPQSQALQAASAQDGSALVSEPQAAPAPTSSPAKRLDADEVAMFTNRGMDYLKNGDYPAARLLLERAANAGSPSAALMLATTFDPLFLPQLRPNGIEPDVAQARHWYEKALEFGSDDAAQRLAELERIGK